MTSEWMKVMLDEIARKKSEAEQARLEEQARSDAAAAQDVSAPQSGCDTVG
jgi:hypothetical protein